MRIVLGFALACGALGAQAQTVVVNRLPALLALDAVAEAVTVCAKQGHAVTAVVVNTDGVRQALLRGDVAPIHTLDTAYMRAYTAVSVAPISRTESSGGIKGAVQAPNVAVSPGGLTIRSAQEVVAAIGVAGASAPNIDEQCARAGLNKIRDRIK